MDMTFDTKRFIFEIESRSSIWDSSAADYSNRDIKREHWKEIVHIFGGSELKKTERKELERKLQRRWKNIRGCYTRELSRKRAIQSGLSGGPRKNEYMYFSQLKFLQKVVTSNADAAQEFEDPSHESDGTIEHPIKRKRKKESSDDSEDEAFITVFEEPIKVNDIKRKRSSSASEEAPFSNLPLYNESIDKGVEHGFLNEDEDRMFLLSLVRTLKKVPEHKKMKIKIKIMSLLDEATQSLDGTKG